MDGFDYITCLRGFEMRLAKPVEPGALVASIRALSLCALWKQRTT
jgi:hypothetical protein